MKTNSKTNAQFDYEHHENPSFDSVSNGAKFSKRIRVNRRKLCSDLKSQHDFIVCGAGSSGSVVARRLAENPDLRVLLEAGGDDEAPSVRGNPARIPPRLWFDSVRMAPFREELLKPFAMLFDDGQKAIRFNAHKRYTTLRLRGQRRATCP